MLLNQSADPTWVVGLDFHLVYANKAYFDLRKSQTVGQKKLNRPVFTPDDSEEFIKRWKSLYQRAFNGEEFEIDIDETASEYTDRNYNQIKFQPLFSEDNQIMAVACQSRGIPSTVKQKPKAKELIDSSLDVFCTTNEQGLFTYVSAAANNLWGYKPEELIGKPFQDLILEEDVAKTIEVAGAIREGRDAKSFVNRYKKKEGGIAYNSWSVRWDEHAKLMYGVARDISEKIEQDEKIQQSEQRFKALVQEGSDLIGIIDEEGNYKYVSPTSSTVLGISPEEFIGRNAFDFIHPDDAERALISLKKIATQNRVKVEPYRFQNHKKEWRWLETILTNMLENPAVEGIVANSRDVTDKIEQEQKIQLSQKRFESLVENSMDCIVIISPEGRTTYVSGSVKNILGYSPSEVMAMDFRELVHPEDLPQAESALLECISNPGVSMKGYTSRVRHKNGSWRWIEPIITNLLHDPAINGIVDNFRDITEQVEEKQHLKLLESVITNTNDAVLITEAEPFDEPGPKIIYVNEAFTKMTGYTAAEVFGKTPRILQGPKSDKEELAKLSKAIRNWEPYEITTINYTKSGEEFCINFTVTPVADEKGWYTHWIAIERDVTESIEAKEKLIRAKEVAEENERKMKEAQKLAHLGSWYYDVINKVSYWSEETYNIWGLNPETTLIELVDHQKLVHPKDWERFNAVINDATEKGIPYKMELELTMPNGYSKIVNTIGEPIFNEENKVIAFRGTTQDITERKVIENELINAKEKAEKSEYTMNQASRLAKIGYWYYDSADQRFTWSDYVYRLYNLTPEDNAPSYAEANGYFDAQSQEKITKATEELDKNGTSYDLELRMINSKNEEIWVRNLVEPVYNDQNEIIGKRGIIQNITEEKSLRDLNDDVAKMVRIGSWSVDLEKNTVFWSEPIHLLHETDSKSYVPNLEEGINFYREDFRQMVQSEVENTIKTGEGWDFEAVIVTAKKNERWIRSIGNAEFSNGKCVRLYGGFQDIDDRKQAEDRLQSLADNLPGIIYQYAMYPDGTDALLHVSGDVEKIWGFTANQVLENTDLLWNQIKLGGDFEQVQASIQKSIQTKSKWIDSYKYVFPTGKVCNLLSFGSPSFLADGTILFNSIILDNTQQAKNEELLSITGKLAKIGGWEVDFISKAVYWTKETHLIHETDPDSFTPNLEGAINFYREDFHELLRSHVEECITTGKPYEIEAILITANKKELWVRSNASAEFINGVCTRIYGSIQDIHEQKTAALELERSIKALEDYKYSLDQAAIIAITDQKGIITSINNNFVKISGHSQNELIGNTHQIINANYHPKSFFTELWKTIASGKVWRGEIKNKAKDGSYYWVDTTIVPFLNEKNKPSQYLAIRFDITEQKKAEENLKVTTERLRIATSGGNIGIWDWDVLNDHLIWDETMYRIFGVEESEFQGAYQAFEATVHPDDLDDTNEKVQSALKGLSKFKTEFRIIRKDKSIRYLTGEAVLVYEDTTGRPTRLIGTNIDITERKVAEQEKIGLQKTIENSLNEIYTFDAETYLFSYVNQGALLNLGYSEQEIKNLTPLDLKPDYNIDSFNQLVAPLVKNKKKKIIFFTKHKRKDGSLYPVEVHLQLVSDGNNLKVL